MENRREKIYFQRSWYEAIKQFDEYEQLQMYTAIFDYAFKAIEPKRRNFTSETWETFQTIKNNIDRQ